jgi:hypothetical protein
VCITLCVCVCVCVCVFVYIIDALLYLFLQECGGKHNGCGYRFELHSNSGTSA